MKNRGPPTHSYTPNLKSLLPHSNESDLQTNKLVSASKPNLL